MGLFVHFGNFTTDPTRVTPPVGRLELGGQQFVKLANLKDGLGT
jgi:hypothetical protein